MIETKRIPLEDEKAAESKFQDTGRLGIPYLYAYWHRSWLKSREPASRIPAEEGEWDLDNTLLSGLGLNILETSRFLFGPGNTGFDSFEEWIIETNGGSVEEARLARLRDALLGKPVGSAAGCLEDVPGLTLEELAFWDEHGYVVVHDAVASEDRDAAAKGIYDLLGVDPSNLETWYKDKFGRTIWVPLLRHPAFVRNRNSARLVKAFAQLWGREDLWSTVDQGGFNPPERPGWNFPGPHIHWDMTLQPPHCFGVQGILYLTDTTSDQGAFSCIPGFHRTLETWLRDLPPSDDPRKAILRHPGFTPIAGRAGDLILWHQALPHGSSPNRSDQPRVAQYITLRPTRWPYTREWK